MSLTKAEQRGLKFLRTYEKNPPTYKKSLIAGLPITIFLPVGLSLVAYAAYQDGQPLTSMACLGAICGSWGLFFRNINASIRLWKFLIHVIDWQKYDQLLEAESTHGD